MGDPSVFGFRCDGKYKTLYDFLDIHDLDKNFEEFIKDIDHKDGWEQLKRNCKKLKIVDGDGDFQESFFGRHGTVLEKIRPVLTFLKGIFDKKAPFSSLVYTAKKTKTLEEHLPDFFKIVYTISGELWKEQFRNIIKSTRESWLT